jgi:DNA-binding transcriptional LysR family regulator
LLDLTLLRVLAMLLEEKNVTRAAQRLHLTPSAVSHALGRLRIVMNDELFIRGAQQMQPTPLALDIGPRVQSALRELERALVPFQFNPAETTRQFILSMSHYQCLTLLPHIMRQLHDQAPHAKIQIRPRLSTLISDFDTGKVDIAVGQLDQLPERFAVEPLITDEWVWVVRRQSAQLMAEPLTLERLAALPHVLIRTGVSAGFAADPVELALEAELSVHDTSNLDLERALRERGLAHRVSLNVPDGISALAIAGRAGLAALVPRRLARLGLEHFNLEGHAPPYQTSEIAVQMAWLRSHSEDPGAHWLRSLIRIAAKNILEEEARASAAAPPPP